MYLIRAKSILLGCLLFLVFYSNCLHAGLVYFSTLKKKQYGFVAKLNKNYYAFTSQAALLRIGPRVGIKTTDGKVIPTTGPLELSVHNDIARIKLSADKAKELALTIGGDVLMNEEIKLFSGYSSTPSESEIIGVGIYSFAIDEETPRAVAGTPILSTEGQVLGVLSLGHNTFRISSNWGSKKISLMAYPNKHGARMDIPIQWVSAKKANFKRACAQIVAADKLQAELLPMLNWWCKNPYRQLPDDVKYPLKLKPWVNDHNNKTKAYDTIIERCRQKPTERKGLIENVMDGTRHRSLKLSKFPKSKIRQMDLPWETEYLTYRANIYKHNWQQIDRLITMRMKDLEYKVPYSFTPDPKETKKK